VRFRAPLSQRGSAASLRWSLTTSGQGQIRRGTDQRLDIVASVHRQTRAVEKSVLTVALVASAE
jgi:hypothetical protein